MANSTKVFEFGIVANKFGSDHRQPRGNKEKFNSPCLLDSDTVKLFNDIKYHGFILRNDLVSIERVRRDEYRKLVNCLSPDLPRLFAVWQKLDEQYDLLVKRLQSVKDPENPRKCVPRHKRKLNPECVAISAELDSLGAERKEAYQVYKNARIAVTDKCFLPHDTLWKEMKDNAVKDFGPRDHRRKEAVAKIDEQMFNDPSVHPTWKEKRRLDILADEWRSIAEHKFKESLGAAYSGVVAYINDAAESSFKTSHYMPRFKAFADFNIGIGIQLQGGRTFEQLLSGQDKTLAIKIEDTVIRGHNKAATATIRLAGKTKNTKNVKVPFVLHRDLPEGAKVTWVYVMVKRVGTQPEYRLQLTANIPAVQRAGSGTIAINSGWRVLDNGDIRVAVSWDGKTSEEVVLPHKMRDQQSGVEALLGHADEHFDIVKSGLVEWLKTASLNNSVKEKIVSLSRSVTNRVTLAQWRSHSKLAMLTFKFREEYLSPELVTELWRLWKQERFANGLDLFVQERDGKKTAITFDEFKKWLSAKKTTNANVQMALYLEWWRRKDVHLVDMARRMQRKSQLHRREIYRCTAARWASKYNSVVVEQWDKRATAKKPKAEKDERKEQEVNANAVRQLCGISVFHNALEQKFGKHYQKENAENISVIHFGCNGIAEPDQTSHMLRCSGCHKLFDRDLNAAMHLFERSGDSKKPRTARKPRNSSKPKQKSTGQNQKGTVESQL